MTPERFRRLRQALVRRQPDLTVILENVHKPHNFAAILRTADAVGLFEAHAVRGEGGISSHHVTASGTEKWVRTRVHTTLSGALSTLGGDWHLLAAHPGAGAIDYREIDYTRPTAILFGQEKDGLTAAARTASERTIEIPLLGLVTSLNVSVAAALVLFEAQRQRQLKGLYGRSRLEAEVFDRTLFEWAYPVLAAHCRRRRVPYPRLADDGELIDPMPR